MADAFALALQRDGKIVVAGSDFSLIRLNRDGTPDTGFGSGGKVSTEFFGTRREVNALAIQPNGRIVAGGLAFTAAGSTGFTLARYLRDGRLDPSFGTGGTVFIQHAGDLTLLQVNALALRGGQIVAAGPVSNARSMDFGVLAFRGDGALDPRFGDGGVVTGEFTTAAGEPFAIVPIRGGLAVAGRYSRSSYQSDIAVMYICDA
jgi:uncharacterized delta-60 repeat protein